MSSAMVLMNDDGSFQLTNAAVEMGQGAAHYDCPDCGGSAWPGGYEPDQRNEFGYVCHAI